jgi:hypothetical protein
MNHAAYWIARTPHPDSIVVRDIDACNSRIAQQSQRITNILTEAETFSQAETLALISQYHLPEHEERFHETGEPFQKETYKKIRENINTKDIPHSVKTAFGVIVARTVVRAFPTWEVNALSPCNVSFDRFQETEIDVFTPVCALHVSADGEWVFAKTPLYSGWIPTNAVAWVKHRSSLEEHVHPKNFLMTTGSVVMTNTKNLFLMGTRIPLSKRLKDGSYQVLVPQRSAEGFLEIHAAHINATADVHEGFLPYTARNLFQQIFKMQGEPYSWGGRTTGRDCTRLILDTLRTFGIIMPRNSGDQRHVGKEILNRVTTPQQDAIYCEAIAALPPGTFLYSDGHAMTYLGTEHGHHYIIHAFSGYQHIATRGGAPLFGAHVTDASIIRGGLAAIDTARSLQD